MAAISNDNLRARLAAILKVVTSDATVTTSSVWEQLITDCAAQGYQEILSRLTKRGFTKAQIDSWSRLTEFNVDISLFWLLTKGAGLHGYDDKFIAKLDRRDELDTVFVLDTTGIEILPTGDDQALVGHGDLSTATDSFVPDFDDDRRGETTQW